MAGVVAGVVAGVAVMWWWWPFVVSGAVEVPVPIPHT